MQPCQRWVGLSVADKLHPGCCPLAPKEGVLPSESIDSQRNPYCTQSNKAAQCIDPALGMKSLSIFRRPFSHSFPNELQWNTTQGVLWGTANTRQNEWLISALSMREDGAMEAKGFIVEWSGYIHGAICSVVFVNHHVSEDIQSELGLPLGPPLVISQAQIGLPKQRLPITSRWAQTPTCKSRHINNLPYNKGFWLLVLNLRTIFPNFIMLMVGVKQQDSKELYPYYFFLIFNCLNIACSKFTIEKLHRRQRRAHFTVICPPFKMYITTGQFFKADSLRYTHSPTANAIAQLNLRINYLPNKQKPRFPHFKRNKNAFYIKNNYNSFFIYHHKVNLDKLKYDHNFTL